MRMIRKTVGELIGAGAARKVRVLYGGSVNASNVESYVELPLCDGCLVGGASLNAEGFARIVGGTAGGFRPPQPPPEPPSGPGPAKHEGFSKTLSPAARRAPW